MSIFTKKINVKTKKDEIVDITEEVKDAVKESKLKNGIATVFVVGSTAAISTMEYEPGLLKDIPKALERIAPSDIKYEHHETWHDNNGKSHVRATLIGPGIVIPFVDEKLTLGTWQQVVLMNLDTTDREREIVIQIIGE